MKTKEQILTAIESGKRKSEIAFIEARDFKRLTDFFPVSDWHKFGFELKEGAKAPEPEELTEENVLKHLKSDLAFAFEKALNMRGISSSLMFEVIKTWMWVLDDPLMNFNKYSMYGLPLYKAVALKYGFKFFICTGLH
jgi:hypothetical protein